MMRFNHRVALVVGAASGIAAATARKLFDEGATVAGVDRHEGELHGLMQSLGDGTRTLSLVADATAEADAQRAVDRTVERFGRIDILITAVGGSLILKNPNATVEELTLDDWQRVVSFNLLPPFLFARAVVPVMKRQGTGCIVNVSSHAATGRMNRNGAYATSKAGVSGLTRKLAYELGPFGIRCNDILLGRTRTVEAAVEEARRDPAGTAAYLQTIPLRRIATPEDAAGAICFLASDEAAYVTGATLDVTGGK